jgi:hypothetical protein
MPEKKRSISYPKDWKIEKKFFDKLRRFKNENFNSLANRDKKYGLFDVETI